MRARGDGWGVRAEGWVREWGKCRSGDRRGGGVDMTQDQASELQISLTIPHLRSTFQGLIFFNRDLTLFKSEACAGARGEKARGEEARG